MIRKVVVEEEEEVVLMMQPSSSPAPNLSSLINLAVGVRTTPN